MIAIIDAYGGNIASVKFALERLGKKSFLTTDAKTLRKASHVILPGVASAKQSMDALQKFSLSNIIQELQQPVLGICLGMQILFEYSEEGEVPCLGIIPGKITHLRQASSDLPVPHMGWNQLEISCKSSPLLKGIENKAYFYYVHSYAAKLCSFTIGKTEYGMEFSAVVQKNNFFGTQFHPERSGKAGETLLKNFLEI